MTDKDQPSQTVEKSKLNLEFNLRSRAMGIHFDSKNLHVVGIRNNINQLLYKNWETLPGFEMRSDEEVQDFLEEFQSRTGIKRADVYMLLPRSEVICQLVEFPPEAANNLDEVMEYQLVNYFAVDQDEYDFFPQIVGRGDQLKVMIVAVKKAFLGHTFGFIRRWNLKLSGLSLDTFGLVNGLLRLEPDRFAQRQVMAFRAFPDGLEMIALKESRLRLSHFIPLKKDEDSELPYELNLEELHQGIEEGFSTARMDPNEVDEYLWVGDYQEEARQYLMGEAGIPFISYTDGAGEPIPDSALTGFGGAVCAVHDNVKLDLNMLPEKQRKRHKRLPVIVASGFVAIVLIFVMFTQVKGYMELREENERLQARYDQFNALMLEVGAARANLETKKEELALYNKFQTNNMLVRIVDSMARDLDDETYLTSLMIKNNDDITIQGEAGDPFAVQRTISKMPFLTDVKSSNAITQGRNQDGKRRFMYKARVVMEELR